MAKKVDIIYGGQFGSEAKRLMIEYYVEHYKPDMIISNFGPNSGGYVSDGGKWATFPMRFEGKIMLSPGSIIDMVSFFDEYIRLPLKAEILIHNNACVVSNDDIKAEKKLINIGSTMTGTMEAVMKKMSRNPDSPFNTIEHIDPMRPFRCSQQNWMRHLKEAKRILLVIPQGHSLSLNHGIYPYCTSRNTSPMQGMADAGIPPQWINTIIGCFRTFPIRVSNRFNEAGDMVGFSGPGYKDQEEMTWEQVGQPPEITSVSKKVRRVFSFSFEQFMESIIMNGCTDVFLNFLNYLSPDEQGKIITRLVRKITNAGLDTKITFFGYGPTTNDIKQWMKVNK